MFRKALDYGQAGDNVGALLRGLKRDDVRRGQVLCAPGSIKTYKKFQVRRHPRAAAAATAVHNCSLILPHLHYLLFLIFDCLFVCF